MSHKVNERRSKRSSGEDNVGTSSRTLRSPRRARLGDLIDSDEEFGPMPPAITIPSKKVRVVESSHDRSRITNDSSNDDSRTIILQNLTSSDSETERNRVAVLGLDVRVESSLALPVGGGGALVGGGGWEIVALGSAVCLEAEFGVVMRPKAFPVADCCRGVAEGLGRPVVTWAGAEGSPNPAKGSLGMSLGME
ncbi:hypothetical protein FRB91_011499 [Serendipita sp. 411]|nr:hypothetical protein FRB91_011499 [Serendipita sp. 411]